ncbi:hypothetical protein E2C01_004127 [Portunus trituberculatus]|uniref:Uncharacterized protein n=1 Tax=Portunus trituberculatus TaxID=210409 RepID=A0A5B7CRK7_PORTR|nr:hypothetical protein [Portunus trituberculatus]
MYNQQDIDQHLPLLIRVLLFHSRIDASWCVLVLYEFKPRRTRAALCSDEAQWIVVVYPGEVHAEDSLESQGEDERKVGSSKLNIPYDTNPVALRGGDAM